MAEPLGLLSALFTISTYASSYLKALQGKSKRPRRLSPHCFLEIWDIASWQDPSGSQPQATQSLASARSELEVASALESLVQQRSGTLRVFLNEFDEKALVAYESRVMPAILPFHQQASEQVLSPATSVEALMSLWRGTFGAHWYCLDGWTFLRPSDMSADSSSATRLKAIQLEISQLVGQPDQRWVTTRRKLRFEEEDGRVKGIQSEPDLQIQRKLTHGAFISCGTSFDRRTSRPCIATERFFSQLQDLEKIYTPLRTKSNLEKLFLLQYHHANLNMFSDLLLNISWQYAHRRKEAFDPRHSKLRQWNLKAILNDVDLYRQFSNIGIELQAAIGLLADLLLGQCEEETRPQFAVLHTELAYRCKDVRAQLDRLTDGLEQDLKFLSLARDITQSRDVQTLTLLATLFLPLSLAAGVLSMQYRFNELGDRLYDFFGIVVLLVAIVVVLLVVISIFNLGLEIESRFRQKDWYRLYVRPPIISTFVVIFLTMGCLTLASFIVGMFKNVSLGARIFGWGVLAAVGSPIALAIVVAFFSLLAVAVKWVWHSTGGALTSLHPSSRRKSANSKERDPEHSRANVSEDQAAAKHQSSNPAGVIPVSSQNA